MSGKKEERKPLWSDWHQKRSDWDVSNNKRPKLDIHKHNLSQTSSIRSSASEKPTDKAHASEKASSSSYRALPTALPTKPKQTPTADNEVKFLNAEEEECDVLEAKALAEAADAVEFEIACGKSSTASGVNTYPPPISKNTPLSTSRNAPASSARNIPLSLSRNVQTDAPKNVPASTSKNLPKPPFNKSASTSSMSAPSSVVKYGNNGSSGFDMLFGEELAEDYVEECMMLASQEIQATQNKRSVDNTAYNIFSKDVNAHSSILETSFNFKKPPHKEPPNQPLQKNISAAKTVLPTSASSSSVRTSSNFNKEKSLAVNPQAEAEVRRLSLEIGKLSSENQKLTESLRTKEGEASILRSQLKKSASDLAYQKTVSERSVVASHQQYGEKLQEMGKEIEALKMKLKFQEADNKAAQQRLLLLTQSSPQIKVVQPSTSAAPVPPSTPQRGSNKLKHVSNFLNRSTFEEKQESDQERPKKRPRLSEGITDKVSREKTQAEINNTGVQEIADHFLKPDVKDNESQTILIEDELDNVTWMQDLVNLSVGERLAERLSGLQLVSDETRDQELISYPDLSLDDMEIIPTISLLCLGPNTKKRQCLLDEKLRPRILNCSKSLKSLMFCNDPTSLSANEEASILQVFQECCGIVHYHLFQLQGLGENLSDKQLRERDREIINRSCEILPLHKQYDLLDEKQWYKEELGVEVRRSLGILSELSAAFRFAALLVTGQSEVIIQKHKFIELPEFIEDFAEQSNSLNQASDLKDKFWFLKVLCNTVSVIVRQKSTIALSGVLSGILVLLKCCAQQKTIIEESQTMVSSIIRDVLLTRPPNTVLLFLVDFLVYCSNCEEIMKGLCTNCGDVDCINDTYSGTCFLTKNTCVLQSLCVQLKTVNDSCGWRLVDVLVRWLSLVISQGWGAPSWILSSPISSHVSCCTMLISTVVSLLWDTLETYLFIEEGDSVKCHATSPVEFIEKDKSLQTSLPRIMRKAIALLHGLLSNNMYQHMAHVEGSYELLLRRLSQMSNLNLTPALQRELNQLLKVEQDASKLDSPVTNQDDNKYAEQYWNCALPLLKLSP